VVGSGEKKIPRCARDDIFLIGKWRGASDEWRAEKGKDDGEALS
jgi:hypothetical protein